MNHPSTPRDPLNEVEQREWLAQERAWRDELAGAAPGEDPAAASYRTLMRALRTPLPGALPADFARDVAARVAQPAAVDTRLEQQVQRLLLAALVLAALVACAMYGGGWLRASVAALPLLDRAATINWSAALAACLGLSWAMDVFRRNARPHWIRR
jgi:hypothetical protein